MTAHDLLYPATRGAIFVALLLITGTQTAIALIGRALGNDPAVAVPLQDRLRRFLRPVLLALLFFCLTKGALQLLSFVDPGEDVTPELLRSVLLSGTWGISWLVQLATVALLAMICGKRPRIDARLTAIVIIAQTGMGHAAGSTWPAPIGRIVDTLHLAGAGIWLGTLAALAIVAFPLLRGEEQVASLARVVREFSTYARVGVALVVATGVIAGKTYVGSIFTIAQSTWGQLLLFKLAGMLGVMALGWYNWRIVTPALAGGHPTCRQRLRRAVRLELALGLIMLALTTFLVNTALPGEG